jgi:hypothetical protein
VRCPPIPMDGCEHDGILIGETATMQPPAAANPPVD